MTPTPGISSSGLRRLGRSIVDHPVVLVAWLVAASPVIVATARAIDSGWIATGDSGVVALRALDTLGPHAPLVGQFSQGTTDVAGESTFNLGPLLFWLLALPAQIGSTALIVTMAATNAACLLGIVALAKRRGGVLLVAAVTLGIVVMFGSLPAEAPYDIWNPYAALLPFTLVLFLGWSVACGELRLLPLLLVAASFVVQAHLGYLVPVVGVVAVAATGALRAPRLARAPADERSVPRWAVAVMLAIALCWSAPAIEQVVHRPGNLVLVARSATADRQTLGVRSGGRAVAATMGARPLWLRSSRGADTRLTSLVAAQSALAFGSTAVLVTAVTATMLVAYRRRRYDLVAAGALSGWLLISVGLVAAAVPLEQVPLELLGHTLVWASPASLWVWLMLAWSIGVLVAPSRGPTPRWASRASFAGVGVAAVVATMMLVNVRRDANQALFAPAEAVAAGVAEAVPGQRAVTIEAPISLVNYFLLPSATYALRREGVDVTVPDWNAESMGARYRTGASRPDDTITIGEDDGRRPPGSRVLVRVPGLTVVSLRRRGASRGTVTLP